MTEEKLFTVFGITLEYTYETVSISDSKPFVYFSHRTEITNKSRCAIEIVRETISNSDSEQEFLKRIDNLDKVGYQSSLQKFISSNYMPCMLDYVESDPISYTESYDFIISEYAKCLIGG